MRRPLRSSIHGYSLVEIAIVLTAISLVVGGLSWPFAQMWREDRDNETREYMEVAIHEAVMAYAARTRTVSSEIRFVQNSVASHSRDLRLPEGRPILPCPDLDGDGWEDRNAQISGAVVVLTVRTPSSPSRKDTVNLGNTLARCLDQKGNVPWRTLGVKPADPWGQHYTYWVDHNFSNGTFGFDQTTRGSNMLKFLALGLIDSTYAYAMHTVAGRNRVGAGMLPSRPLTSASPSRASFPSAGLVLRELRSDPTATSKLGHFGKLSPLGGSNLQLVAGDPLKSNPRHYRYRSEIRRLNDHEGIKIPIFEYDGLQVSAGVTIHPARPVMGNGIAFAVVSHGPNGSGGRVYTTRGYADGTDFTCRNFNNRTAQTAELSNARHTYGCAERELIPNSCGTAATLNASCFERNSSNSVFFTRPYTFGGPTDFEFDDIVTWMHPTELALALTERGVLPLPLPPVAIIDDLPPRTRDFTE